MSRSIREKGTVTKAKSLFVWSREFLKIQWPEVGQIPGAAVLLYFGSIGMFFRVAPKSKEYGF